MENNSKYLPVIWRWVKLIILLYLFFLAISLMGGAFKGMGKEKVREILSSVTYNPFAALLIGILTTAIIQSSSTTTSMVVGFVSAGVLGLRSAVPIVMGANIGTTITNLIVSLGHVTRKEEFKRAFSVAVVHDIFNIIAVIVFLPLEIYTHFLERSADTLASFFVGGNADLHYTSPVKAIVKPVAHFIEHLLFNSGMHKITAGIILLILSLALLAVSLVLIVKTMRSVVSGQIENAIDYALARRGWLGIILGAIITAIIQSSSLTTSLLVPLAGAGLLSLEAAFPITLGANLGTTVTALLAALAGTEAGLAIAFVHVLFNLSGIMLIYPIKAIRRIPMSIARFVAQKTYERWYYPIIYVVIIFFLIPIAGMLLFR